MTEGNAGKVAAPAAGMGNSTESAQDEVAEHLAHVEALVGELPHTVEGVGVVGLPKGLLKGNLKVVIEVVGIPGCQVGVRSPCFLG